MHVAQFLQLLRGERVFCPAVRFGDPPIKNPGIMHRGFLSPETENFRDFRRLQEMCLPTSFVISNMLTQLLPLNTAFSLSSALMFLLLTLSCRPFLLI